MSTATEVAPFGSFSDDQLRFMEKLIEVRGARINFAVNHHVNTRGERMDFQRYPHIRELYNSLSPHIVAMGSVQSFKSEWCIIDHFAMAFSGLSVFFVLPKYEMRTTYVQNRVDRCVENVDEYKKIIGGGFFNSVVLKNFGKGVVKYVGSNVLADFKEFPADALCVEEVDQCEGGNLDFAMDRLRASRYQFTRYLGNPSIRNEGIHAFFLRSNQKEWEVPCSKCGVYVELDWFKTVVEDITDDSGNVVSYRLRDGGWFPGCRRDIHCMCPHCGGTLERASMEGRWVPRNSASSIDGYHISMLCLTINTVSSMWDRFQRALSDPGLLKVFFNSDLGLPYSAAGNKVTDTVLDKCIGDYDMILHPNCGFLSDAKVTGPCSMGIDVGITLDVRISEVLARGSRKAVFIGKIRATDEQIIYELMERYKVEKCVIDSQPEFMLALNIQEAAPCDVWLCRYGGEGGDRRKNYDVNGKILTTDRTEALDRSYAKLRTRKMILPRNYKEVLGGEFSSEMCMPTREIVQTTKGGSRYEWTHGKDHQRHADTYDMLAADLMMENVIDGVAAV